MFNILPLLLKKLDIIIIRPPNIKNNDRIRRQFIKDIKIRKSRIRIWQDFLKKNHLDYRYIIINEQRIDVLSVNDNINSHLIYIKLVKSVMDARPNTLFNTEHI